MSRRAKERRRKRTHLDQRQRRIEKLEEDARERIERRKRGGMAIARKEARERELVRIGRAVEVIRGLRIEGLTYVEIALQLRREGIARPRAGEIIWWTEAHVGHLVRKHGL